MNIEKFIRTYQELMVSVAMILVAIVGLIFGVIPAAQKVIALRSESMGVADEIAKLQTKETTLDAIDEQTFRNQLQQLVAAVPTDKSLPTVFSTIDALAQGSGVSVTDLTLDKPGKLASGSADQRTPEEVKIGSSLVPFSVTVAGSYDQIRGFLTQIVDVRRFFRVRNFEISFADPANTSVHLGMDAFYAPLASIQTTVDSALDPFTADEKRIIDLIEAMPLASFNPSGAQNATPQLETTRTDPFSLQ